MSNAFSEREKGFEAKYKLDQETQFRVESRRNRLFGLWVAGKLGKTGAEAEAYAKEVVAADFKEAGHDDVLRKVEQDLNAANAAIAEAALRHEYEALLGKARDQIMAEIGKK
ncbi:MAG: DUF1476 domain-containing protein [Alphaproteobacteria bacterium]|nr:DUF1476 domain-containing protein [Alphaproteobacteria bacterium]